MPCCGRGPAPRDAFGVSSGTARQLTTKAPCADCQLGEHDTCTARKGRTETWVAVTPTKQVAVLRTCVCAFEGHDIAAATA